MSLLSSERPLLPLPVMEDWIMQSLNWTEDMYDFISNEKEEMNSRNAGGGVPCIDAFHSIGGHYKRAHGYIALVVCLFGTVANSLNLVILAQKEMRTPINLVLRALALVDVLVMIEYIPFAVHMYIPHPVHSQSPLADDHFSYAWAVFVLFHSQFTQILHTISIQLTLTMAVWRYVALRFTNQVRVAAVCTFRRCYLAIAASFICPFFLCIPNYLTFTIVHHQSWAFKFGKSTPPSIPPYFRHREAKERETLVKFCEILSPRDLSPCIQAIMEKEYYVVDLSQLAKAHGGALHIIHFWTFSVIVKLLPCVVLTFFMVYLLHTLYAAKQRQMALQHSSGLALTPIKTPSRSINEAPVQGQDLHKCPLISKSPTQNGILSVTHPPRFAVLNESSKSCLTLAAEEPGECGPANRKGRRRTKHAQSRTFFGVWKTTSPVEEHSHPKKSGRRRSDRTSRMLVAVLFLFLITEFPQGIMAFLSGLYGAEFFRKCYNAFAEIWDILALINSALNFILYCFMSRQFRVQFRNFFPVSHCLGREKCGGRGAAITNGKNTINTTLV